MNISEGDDGLKGILELLRACEEDPSGNELDALMLRLRMVARRHLPAASPLRHGLDSEDLAQEGLLQLIRNLDRFRGKTIGEFLAFASAVISQQAAKQARWQQVRRPELRGGEDAAEHATDLNTPSNDVIAEEDAARLRELVEGLAEPYREALRMRLEGKSNLEIAAELNVREDVIRKRLSRALKEIHGQW